ncbi:MAG: diphthine synthase [Thermoplasmata archaeon]
MIGFISSGFNPPYSLTWEEISFMEECAKIVVDTYTSPNYLREFRGKELFFAKRKDLEDFQWMLGEEDVAIVIPGDSFSATTHFAIYKEAVHRGLTVKVFHNSSIFPSAATRLGLHLYKIGPPVSLPRFSAAFRPTSPYDKILDNISRGLHTVVLLDTEPPMTIEEAIEELQWMESQINKGIVKDEREIGVVMALGTKDEKLAFGEIGKIRNMRGITPVTIVIPGELHFQEGEALELFRV